MDVGRILDPAFPDSPAGHRANAEHLVETVVRAHGLDGLDVDMERRLTPAQADRAAAVFAELGRHLGRASGNGSLLIYDTNLDGDEPVFAASAALFDYVLEQSYGRDPLGLEATWATFAPHIPPSRYLIGFSYDEEFDRNLWDDASEPFEDSRAVPTPTGSRATDPRRASSPMPWTGTARRSSTTRCAAPTTAGPGASATVCGCDGGRHPLVLMKLQ